MTNLSDTLAALKPCPFCGGEAALVYSIGNEVWPQSWSPTCSKCGLTYGKKHGSNSWQRADDITRVMNAKAEAEAIAAWNTRTGQLVPVPSVERVARVVADYQMSVGLPPDDAWEDADGIASAVIAAMKEGRE